VELHGAAGMDDIGVLVGIEVHFVAETLADADKLAGTQVRIEEAEVVDKAGLAEPADVAGTAAAEEQA
jgi:hypothetical protein